MKKKQHKPIIVGIVPARAGSVGLPGKNIYPVLGHPMIAWTVRASVECPEITHTFAISDGEQILQVAERYGAQIIKEPAALGAKDIHNWQVIDYALKQILSLGIRPDIIVYLQPTSPLRTSDDITKALKILEKSQAQAVHSVTESDNKFLKSFLIKEGELKLLSRDPWPVMPRALLPRTYLSNGAIFAIRTKVYQRLHSLLAPHTVPYLMPPERSMDIDYQEQAREVIIQMRKAKRKLSRS